MNNELSIPLPEIFWSFETDQPMKHCHLCNCDLMQGDVPYVIEKAFNNGETIFEAALCIACQQSVYNQMSEESRESIRRYFEEHADLPAHHFQSLEEYGTDHEKWISHCLVKGFPAAECGEFQLYGFCLGSHLIFKGAPYILSGEVIDEIVNRLSPETAGLLGEVSDRIFGIDAPKDLLIL